MRHTRLFIKQSDAETKDGDRDIKKEKEEKTIKKKQSKQSSTLFSLCYTQRLKKTHNTKPKNNKYPLYLPIH